MRVNLFANFFYNLLIANPTTNPNIILTNVSITICVHATSIIQTPPQ